MFWRFLPNMELEIRSLERFSSMASRGRGSALCQSLGVEGRDWGYGPVIGQ